MPLDFWDFYFAHKSRYKPLGPDVIRLYKISVKDICYVAVKALQSLCCLFQNATLNKASITFIFIIQKLLFIEHVIYVNCWHFNIYKQDE